MLDAKSAWSLERASKTISVCWEEVAARTKCRMPRALGAAMSVRRQWTVTQALNVLEDAVCTPFVTRANLLRWFFRYVLTPQQLYDVGHATNHIATMRLALRLSSNYRKYTGYLKYVHCI